MDMFTCFTCTCAWPLVCSKILRWLQLVKMYLGLALEPELAEVHYSVLEKLRFPKMF